jgi:hypothetical protein
VTAAIPVHAASVPAGLGTEDADPSPTITLLKADIVEADIAFNPLGLQQQDSLPVSTVAAPSLQEIAVGKSYQTEQDEYMAQVAAQAAAEEAARIQAEAEAAAKAAEEARLKAEQERKAAAAKAAEQARVIASAPSSGEVEDIVRAMTIARYGESQWSSMRTLVMRESGFNPRARNASSGACGLGQALPCNKMPQGINTSVEGQAAWMLDYIANRYGTPNNALAFHNAHNWY